MKKINRFQLRIVTVLGVLALVIWVSLAGKMFYSDVFAPSNNKLPIYSVETKEKKMAITFDVNWGDDNTKEILDILDKYNIKATFYVIGLWCDDYPEQVREIARRGHEIGNHSNKHPNYTKMDKVAIEKDVEIANAKIMALTGQLPKTFRFPSGAYNNSSVEIVEGLGVKAIQWDVDSVDWKAKGLKIEYDKVVSKAKEGSILLFHNDGKYTPENLPKIIEKYQSVGYNFVTVSELIYQSDYHLDHTGRQILN
ncbi:MAG: polysaccharide deacetylase family sporulation protein PdaB [Clostridium sp.]|uniref:polysaccharide deacetylase family sporulation protein PdaB n=1 Tax=Clostridium sp. TaxID=1506 RepID=UPI0032169327